MGLPYREADLATVSASFCVDNGSTEALEEVERENPEKENEKLHPHDARLNGKTADKMSKLRFFAILIPPLACYAPPRPSEVGLGLV